ncbi:MAG TPA: long-chain fatty acid--CoA ligase, partial [Bacteroidota bacterium]
LLVPKKDALLAWMKAHGQSPVDEKGLRAALELLKAEIDAYRPGGHRSGLFPDRWLPAALAILAEGFTEGNGLLNSTLKMVRTRIAECHAERIASLFTADGKDVCNSSNRKALTELLRS